MGGGGGSGGGALDLSSFNLTVNSLQEWIHQNLTREGLDSNFNLASHDNVTGIFFNPFASGGEAEAKVEESEQKQQQQQQQEELKSVLEMIVDVATNMELPQDVMDALSESITLGGNYYDRMMMVMVIMMMDIYHPIALARKTPILGSLLGWVFPSEKDNSGVVGHTFNIGVEHQNNTLPSSVSSQESKGENINEDGKEKKREAQEISRD
eukprot:jgi/Bigna1/145845/aug1.104_g20553